VRHLPAPPPSPAGQHARGWPAPAAEAGSAPPFPGKRRPPLLRPVTSTTARRRCLPPPRPQRLPARRVTSHSASPHGNSPARGQCHDIVPHHH
jgi:hypothetical protein